MYFIGQGQVATEGRPAFRARWLVRMATPAQAATVLRAGPRLRQVNQERKEKGEALVSLDRDLSLSERRVRSSLWPSFKKVREEGKRAYSDGHRLFVGNQEVLPPDDA